MASDVIDRLISGLNRLPGIGEKSARRIALEILTWDTKEVHALTELIMEVKTRVKQCSIRFSLTEQDPCDICSNPNRDHSTVMVVDTVGDLLAVEYARAHRGVYHVLDGRISPLDGVGPEHLHIRELLVRLEKGNVQEVILANGPTVEGDATAQYLKQCLEPFKVCEGPISSKDRFQER